jgi:PEP-CTERM motif
MLKKYRSCAALLLLFSLSLAAKINADTVQLASTGTAIDSGQSDSKGNTIAVAPNPNWAAPLSGSSWVSFGLTGNPSTPGFFVVPNGTIVSFFDVFNISGTPSGGTIRVMADDSATVILNGVTLMTEASMTGNAYATCSDFGIRCLVPVTINLPTSALHTGSNTLEFDVAQRMGSSFGLDYSGSVSDPAPTPEPASVMLLGLGLLMVAMFVTRRKGVVLLR